MNSISLIVLTMLASMLAAYVLILAWRIRNNVIAGAAYRKTLLDRLASLRLSRMLQALGIDKHRYICQQGIPAIEQQMQNCQLCTHSRECDEHARQHEQRVGNIPYCPNTEALHASLSRQNHG